MQLDATKKLVDALLNAYREIRDTQDQAKSDIVRSDIPAYLGASTARDAAIPASAARSPSDILQQAYEHANETSRPGRSISRLLEQLESTNDYSPSNLSFLSHLIDAQKRGIGQLVDADLNEESFKLKALQVQEQLAVQSLGMANNLTQRSVPLFQ